MALSDYKISGSEINTNGVVSAPDILTGTTQENKAIFDKLPTLIINKFNALIDSISATGADEIGVQPFDEITANNIQDALKQIRDLIGTYYSGADGAGKVGYTPSEGVDEDTVQAAIEAVQANLAAYIAKIKAATGAAEVGNTPIVGMTATNVQQALEELKKNIDNIVSGIIPGGSITSDMLQDGAVTEAKLSSDVAAKLGVLGGATTPQGALANLGAGVRNNELINYNFAVNQRGQSAYTANGYTVDMWTRPAGGLTVTPIENGVRLTWTAGIYFRQGFENPSQYNGKSVTISGMFSNPQSITGCSLRLRVNGSFSGFSVPVTGAGCFFATFQMPDEVTELWLEVGAESGSIDWNYAKLEEGDTQTLAYQDDDGAWQLLPQPESDYATQLAKCQRYQLRLPYGASQNYAPIGFGWAQTASSIRILIPTPVTMRANPVISYLSGDISGISLICNGKAVAPTAISHIAVQNYGVAIEFAVSDATANMPCVMRMTSAYMMLDANL